LWFRYFNNKGANKTVVVKMYYGAAGSMIIHPSSNALPQKNGYQWFECFGIVAADNATNAQAIWGGTYYANLAWTQYPYAQEANTLSIDSTAAQTIKFTVQMGEADALEYIKVAHARISPLPVGTGGV
jgi:hypothetical protein